MEIPTSEIEDPVICRFDDELTKRYWAMIKTSPYRIETRCKMMIRTLLELEGNLEISDRANRSVSRALNYLETGRK